MKYHIVAENNGKLVSEMSTDYEYIAQMFVDELKKVGKEISAMSKRNTNIYITNKANKQTAYLSVGEHEEERAVV